MIYHRKKFLSFGECTRAVVIGRRIRPDIRWVITNEGGDWEVQGHH